MTDPTQWNVETIETCADGSEVVTFDNFQGETILQDTWNGPNASVSEHSIVYSQYDSNGNLLAAYQPSAINTSEPEYVDSLLYTEYGYNSSNGNLGVQTYNAAGLVDVYTYYASTSVNIGPTTPGGVAGMLQASGVQQGSMGTPDWQSSVDYFAETGSGSNAVTVYETADSTQYQNNPNSSCADRPRTVPGEETTIKTDVQP